MMAPKRFTLVTQTLKMNSQRQFDRAGVIPYTVTGRNGQQRLSFCLGIDRLYKEFSDFGGRSIPRIDKDGIEVAIREFTEETLGCFPKGIISRTKVKNSVAVASDTTLIVFLRCSVDPNHVSQVFRNKVNQNDEMSDIKWISEEEFKTLVLVNKWSKEPKIYSRVNNLIYPNLDRILQTLRPDRPESH